MLWAMNSLEKSLVQAWELLTNGIRDRNVMFHLAKIATVTLDGRPTQRTVVLRDADAESRQLRFHTDQRSTKVREIANNPAVSVLFYDPETQVQIRIDGDATVHAGDAVAEAAWAETRHFSKACYLAPNAPGTPVSEPPVAPSYDADEDQIAYENFCAVVISVSRLEWMHLAVQGHKRAQFNWDNAGRLEMSWISP